MVCLVTMPHLFVPCSRMLVHYLPKWRVTHAQALDERRMIKIDSTN